MKSKLLLLALFACIGTKICAQQIYPEITQNELQSMRLRLNQPKTNTDQVKLMLKLGLHYISKPGQQKSDHDSAVYFIKRSQIIIKKFNLAKEETVSDLLLGFLYLEKGDNDKFRKSMNEVITEAEQRNQPQIKGEALYFLGTFSEKITQLEYYKNALACFQVAKSLKEEAFMHLKIANTYSSTGNANKELALKSAMKSLELYKKIKSADKQHVYYSISNINAGLNNWPDRVKYLLLAIDESKRTGDSTIIGSYYSDLGGTYKGLKQYQDGLKYLILSYECSAAIRNLSYIYHNANMISETYFTLKQPEKALNFYKTAVKNFPPETINQKITIANNFTGHYMAIKRFDMAEPYCIDMLKLEEQLNRKDFSTMSSYTTAAAYYLHTKDYTKAEFYLKEATKLNVTNQTGFKRWILNYFFKLDSARGNLLSAIGYYQKYKTLNDSVLNEGKLKQIAELQIQYETKKKEADLLLKDKNITALNERTLLLDQEAKNRQTLLDKALLQSQKSDLLRKNKDAELAIRLKNIKLLKQQSEIQKSQLNQAYVTRAIVVCFSILLITLLVLLFRQFRLKQSANQIIEQKNQRLESLVNEKNWLLKEVHHRVKNNLQTVISLLESQAFYLKDDAYKAMQNCQHRIYVMSLIHQKLYQSEEVKSILMPLYIAEFVSYLSESLEVRQNISFQQDIDEIELNINQAVPLALIINEAVTNSIKYAFPNKQFGIIQISLKQILNKVYLEISDNGIGISAIKLNQNTDTLGLKLMRGLSCDLNGAIEISNDNGTSIQVNFEMNETYQVMLLDAV